MSLPVLAFLVWQKRPVGGGQLDSFFASLMRPLDFPQIATLLSGKKRACKRSHSFRVRVW